MKRLLFILLLLVLLSGCMKPYLISVHGESFTLHYDPLQTNEAQLIEQANQICAEKFNKSAILTNNVANLMYGGDASFDCK